MDLVNLNNAQEGFSKQQTPIKKNKELEFKSAQTQGKTPQKLISTDIDAQYLFQHFDELVKISYKDVDSQNYLDVNRQLDYEETDGFLSPMRQLKFFQNTASMKKKPMGKYYIAKPKGIQLFPIEAPKRLEKLSELKVGLLFQTCKKIHSIDESKNILIPKQRYRDQISQQNQ